MERRDFVRVTFAAASAAFMPENLVAGFVDELPKVLLLGDSISIGYTPFVKEMLKGKANVFRPTLENGNPENCNGTTKGVTETDRWIGETKWDIIHFNFGLHDLKHVNGETGANSNNPGDPLQADPKQYKRNLSVIVQKLRNTGAVLIFATTTPYKEVTNPLRDNGMFEKYNRIALKLMKKNNIKVNDLCSFILPRLAELQMPNNVHFTEPGYKVLATEVVRNLTEHL